MLTLQVDGRQNGDVAEHKTNPPAVSLAVRKEPIPLSGLLALFIFKTNRYPPRMIPLTNS